jgi:crotonobetainyl-CoA:carnitine CoA-transferase CaiB-like acyl-CoA transferase
VNRTAVFLGIILVACAASLGWSMLRKTPTPPLPTLRVEVLNGCGEEGLAASTAQRLRDLGQDVVRVADADHHDYARCLLIDRGGRPWLARRLAERLGSVLVVLEREDGSEVDLTLILGRDHSRALAAPDGS